MKNIELEIIDGTIENQVYESHSRGKNWVATVVRNLKSPGGIDRTFWTCRAKFASIPENLSIGEYIEMAGDYYSGRGNRTPKRAYFRVVDRTETSIEVCETKKSSIDARVIITNPLAKFCLHDLRHEIERRMAAR